MGTQGTVGTMATGTINIPVYRPQGPLSPHRPLIAKPPFL